MTVHAPSDVRAVIVPVERGGCGQPHEAGDLADGEHFTVDCDKCEPHLVNSRQGFAYQKHQVGLTTDEIAIREAQENAAKSEQNRTWGDPALFAQTMAQALQATGIAGAPAPAAKGLLEQIAALSDEEKAALRDMLAPGPAAVEAAPATQPVGDEESAGDVVEDISASGDEELPLPDAPVKRGPGRPRTRP